MLKPIHTHKTRYYEILRPCLWFAENEKIDIDKINEYFTQKAITSLMDYGFIKLVIK